MNRGSGGTQTRRHLSASLLRLALGCAVTASLFGAEPAFAAAPTPAPLSAPGDLEVFPGDGFVTVGWSQPSFDGGSPINYYLAVATDLTDPQGGQKCLVQAPTTSCVLSPMTNGNTYTVTVEAHNANGFGPGATSSAVTPEPSTTPGGKTVPTGTTTAPVPVTTAPVTTSPTTTSGAAGGEPTVSTGPATATAPTVADPARTMTLNGTIAPRGETSGEFEYGTTTSYGHVTPLESVGSGSAAVEVRATITLGLAASTLYHYRLVAINSSGSTYGADKTISTPANGMPPVAVTGAAITTRPTLANPDRTMTLDGTVTANGASTTEFFEYGQTTAYGHVTTVENAGSGSTAAAVDASVASGLTASTLYHYRLVATNEYGTTYGADRTITTLADEPPPTVALGSVTQTRFKDSEGLIEETITLTAVVTPNGYATCYVFYYYFSATTCVPIGSGQTGVFVTVTEPWNPPAYLHTAGWGVTASNEWGETVVTATFTVSS